MGSSRARHLLHSAASEPPWPRGRGGHCVPAAIWAFPAATGPVGPLSPCLLWLLVGLAVVSTVALLILMRLYRELARRTRELNEIHRSFATLLSNLPGIAYRCRNDADWTMEFISDGCLELTGYWPSDLIHNRTLSYAELILPEDREGVWDDVQEAVSKKMPFKLVYRIRTAEGDVKWVWEQGRGVFSSEGKLEALEGFITDVTEQKLAEQQLRRLASSESADETGAAGPRST